MALKRLVLTFTPEGVEARVLYRRSEAKGGPNPGTKARRREVAELKARRGKLAPDDERHVRELMRRGFGERAARQEVAAKDHPIDCECEVCG